jgi:hypothetical protein
MLFRVLDEITDMTRSLEMVERKRFIYWKVVFRHRNGSERFRYIIGVPEGYRNPPGKLWALLGHTGKRGACRRGCCAPPLAGLNWTRGWGVGQPAVLLPLPLFLPLLVDSY